jgi:two-component system, OmpR family, alkaline phosphatase synthesis response regulator PhoP
MKKKKILLVEDEASLLQLLSDKLIEFGFFVSTAKNGMEGLKAALKIHPDLILLDIVMPIMDGMTMLKKLRADSWGKSANVILLTNLSSSYKASESSSMGVTEYIIKSDWILDDIVKRVKNKLTVK